MAIVKCPKCGVELEMDDSREFMFCFSCGTRIEKNPSNTDTQNDLVNAQNNPAGVQNPAPAPTQEQAPNLNIQYASINPAVGMVVRFTATNQMAYFVSGQQFSFRVPYGMQQLVLKIGKISYNRTIFLRDDNAPVTIYASWDGRAHITIDQPYIPQAPVQPVVPVQPMYQQPMMQQPVMYQQPVMQQPMMYQQPIMPVQPVAYPAPAPATKNCPTCGKTLEIDALFCTACGTKLTNS